MFLPSQSGCYCRVSKNRKVGLHSKPCTHAKFLKKITFRVASLSSRNKTKPFALPPSSRWPHMQGGPIPGICRTESTGCPLCCPLHLGGRLRSTNKGVSVFAWGHPQAKAKHPQWGDSAPGRHQLSRLSRGGCQVVAEPPAPPPPQASFLLRPPLHARSPLDYSEWLKAKNMDTNVR